jgi:hypothetical protein
MRPEALSRNVLRCFATLVPAVLVLAAATAAAAGPEPPPAEVLPPDHPAWGDIESLFNRGGLAGLPVFTRPLPRGDVARALATLREARPDLARLAAARRLERELAWELERLGTAGAFPGTPPVLEGTAGDALFRARAGLDGRIVTTGGRGDVVPGTRGGVAFRAYLPGGGFALADVSVEKITGGAIGDAIVKNSDWYLSSRDAYLSWRTAALDVRAGLATNRWGPGSSGTLLLSDAAMSYPALELSRTFGERARAVAMVGTLHEPGAGAGTGRLQFAAHRIELGFGPVRLGLHEAAAYRADGLELLYAVGVVPYTLVQRWLDRATPPGSSLLPHRNNVLVGFDVTWRMGAGFRADGEFLVDDVATESASQPDRIGYQVGLSWAGAAGGQAVDARAEFVKVHRHTYAVFYDADFVLDGVPLGYGNGPDVEHAEAWAERDLGIEARVGAGIDLTRRGEGVPGDPWDPATGGSRGSGGVLSGVVERRVFPHVRFRGLWRDVADLRLKAGVLDARNAGHAAGADDRSFHVQVVARAEW